MTSLLPSLFPPTQHQPTNSISTKQTGPMGLKFYLYHEDKKLRLFKLNIYSDMKIVAGTTSTLAEPSQKSTLKTHDPLTFAFEEPSKQRICLRNLRPQFSSLHTQKFFVCFQGTNISFIKKRGKYFYDNLLF